MQVKVNDKSKAILEKWVDKHTFKKKTDFVNEAILEYDICLSMKLKPSQAEYDEYVNKRNEVK